MPTTMYSKNGAYPVIASALPKQDFDANGKIWTHLAANTAGRVATGWVDVVAPDYDPQTEILSWDGNTLTVAVKPPEPESIINYTVSHKEFLDLLTASEKIAIKAMRKRVEALTEAEFLDPVNIAYQMFDLVMEEFDKSTAIQLSHPQTQSAFNNVLIPLGILEAHRPNEITNRLVPDSTLPPE